MFNFTNHKYPAPLERNIIDWVWPIPSEVAEMKMRDAWWTPAKVYYPLIQALQFRRADLKDKNSASMRYSNAELIKIYSHLLHKYWKEGHNIVFGTEATDTILRIPRHKGQALVRTLAKEVVPGKGSEVTVVVTYRMPKIKHLISMWHQNRIEQKKRGEVIPDKFYEWITTTTFGLDFLDALDMVNRFIEYTDWNIALVDLEGLAGAGWDPSNFIVCEILDELCMDKKPLALHDAHIAPLVVNVRSNETPPNVPNVTLEQIDRELIRHDCKYINSLEGWIGNGTEREATSTSRVKVHHPKGIYDSLRIVHG